MATENLQEIGLIAYHTVYGIARRDVARAEEMLNESDEGFNRRTFVRAMFAFIEADVWGRKRIALLLHERSAAKPILTIAEVAIASEEIANLKEDGSASTTSPRLKFLPNLKFSFRAFAAAFEVQNYSLEIAEAGWSDLRNAVRIRDRLMHPKGGNSFTVSDDEIAVCTRALGWYDAASSRLFELAAEVLTE